MDVWCCISYFELTFISVVGVGPRRDVRQKVDPSHVVRVRVLLARGQGIRRRAILVLISLGLRVVVETVQVVLQALLHLIKSVISVGLGRGCRCGSSRSLQVRGRRLLEEQVGGGKRLHMFCVHRDAAQGVVDPRGTRLVQVDAK